MNRNMPSSAPPKVVDEDARAAAIARLRDVFSNEGLSSERFSEVLGQIVAAPDHAALETAMSALPPVVRLTPASRRLPGPLVLRAPDSELELGSGWQLAPDTTIGTGFGSAQVDLNAASWDAHQIDLHLETWGAINVLVPKGVAVQIVGASGSIDVGSLSTPVPGGPLLRISTCGPTGVIRIRHPQQRNRLLKRRGRAPR